MNFVTTPKGCVIEFRKQDWTPGFAAYVTGPGEFKDDAPAFCILDLSAFLLSFDQSKETRDDLFREIADSMMHECCHVLEHWLGLEFNEDRIESVTAAYRGYAQQPELVTMEQAVDHVVDYARSGCDNRGDATVRFYRRVIEKLTKLAEEAAS